MYTKFVDKEYIHFAESSWGMEGVKKSKKLLGRHIW